MYPPDEDLAAFLELLEHLESSSPPHRNDVLRKRQARPDYAAMSENELADFFKLKQLAHTGTIFADFQQRLGENFPEKTKNNLGENVTYVRGLLHDQIKYGTRPAPDYASRIGVLLRKAKLKDLSMRFELAYRKHVVDS
ncbi:hypothetical protein [Pseudophaeobacter sp. EL27]|uniref:hypothetical protein n=1 Tax=Pseudophaeobacter sp. EL27 TaxID=2107580 RepID=UPI000EFB1633|nr:hypothetical protein [Pseudophaeobacter sp. EL27]